MTQSEQFADRCYAALSSLLPEQGETFVTPKEDILKILAGSWEAFDLMRLQQNKRAKFVPPTLAEVREYVKERGSCVDPVWFYDFYSNGNPPWHDSRGQAVRSWKQKLIMHDNRGGRAGDGGQPHQNRPQQASLGALQMELENVRSQIKSIINPGGAAWNKTASQLSAAELEQVTKLDQRRESLKQRIACF